MRGLLATKGTLFGERNEKLERAWRQELQEFTSNGYFEGGLDEFRVELAHFFEEEVPDLRKSSYTWSLYEIMNCMDDRELDHYGVTITEVAEDVELLVDLWKTVVRKHRES